MRQRGVRLLQQWQYAICRGTTRECSDDDVSRHKKYLDGLSFVMCVSLAAQSQAAELFTDLSNPLSEFANNFAAVNCCQRLINARVDIFRNESNRSVTQTELSTPRVCTAEVIEVSVGMIWSMVG